MYPSEAALADQHALAALGALFNALDVTARPFAAAWLPWIRNERHAGRFVGWPPPGGPRAHPRPQAHHRENPGPAHMYTDTGHEREFARFLGRRVSLESLPPTPT